ncbi:unnamed protein product [Triticum turgidum subsp. durum]|uniref:LRAT domain-containing protein n=1 Tax=Triticum turgidum subsp. durum TaxID=4567 RepID=A0A9R1AJ95_TRITD|nr:unnamed protein product [Triticum turgidum subsp. durum]
MLCRPLSSSPKHVEERALWHPLTLQLVVHRAKHLLNNGFGMYSLFKNNCEDFAIYCKTELLVETAYSVGRSGQLASLTAAFSAVASSPLRFLTTSASGLAIVTSGMYCVGRYVSDMGVRRDVIKVPVERLVEHWVNNVTPALPQGATQPETATPGGSPLLPGEGELAKMATPGGFPELPGEGELAKTATPGGSLELPGEGELAKTATPGSSPELLGEGELAKAATPGGSPELPGEGGLAKKDSRI